MTEGFCWHYLIGINRSYQSLLRKKKKGEEDPGPRLYWNLVGFAGTKEDLYHSLGRKKCISPCFSSFQLSTCHTLTRYPLRTLFFIALTQLENVRSCYCMQYTLFPKLVYKYNQVHINFQTCHENTPTVEPPSKGHLGTNHSVNCREDVLFLEVSKCITMGIATFWMLQSVLSFLYQRFHYTGHTPSLPPQFCPATAWWVLHPVLTSVIDKYEAW